MSKINLHLKSRHVYYSKRFNPSKHTLPAVILIFLIILFFSNRFNCQTNFKKYYISPDILKYDEFKDISITDSLIRQINKTSVNIDALPEEVLSLGLILNNFSYKNLNETISEKLTSKDSFNALSEKIDTDNKNNKNYTTIKQELTSISKAILEDFIYFPIALKLNGNTNSYYFSDSWQANRSYGGERVHEGCDIMTKENVRNYYPVVSMCDGVVENKGWLELGGYRLGIRSTNGLYIYYAHLASYDDRIDIGATVKAGQLLGYAGDTGYSKVEGTTGNFKVHLHVGIYFHYSADDGQLYEVPVNPYTILKRLEGNYIKYDY